MEDVHVDEATGQACTHAKHGRRRKRKDRETGEDDTAELESEIVEIPAKKVHSRCYETTLLVCIYCFPYCLQPKKWKNKQRVLVFCARGITYRLALSSKYTDLSVREVHWFQTLLQTRLHFIFWGTTGRTLRVTYAVVCNLCACRKLSNFTLCFLRMNVRRCTCL